MNSNKIWNWISGFVLLVQATVEVLLTVFVLRLNVLPERYVIILYVAMAALLLVTAGVLFLRGKKPVSLARRIIGMILVALIICVCLIGAKMINEAYQTLHKVTTTEPVELEENTMNVFVRMDDPAKTLKDTAKYVYAVIAEHDEDIVQEALVQIQSEIGTPVTQVAYEDLIQMTDALLSGDVDAVLISDIAMIILSEDEEGYLDLFDKIRSLYSIPMSQLEEATPTTEPSTEATEPPKPPAEITQEPFIVYLCGSDSRSKKLKKKSRNDVNILAVVNPQTKQVLLINTPRDYYVENPAGRNKLDKLTNCGIYGTENSMKSLAQLYDLKVDYYAQINFTGVETLVDAIGGITVNSTEAFSCGDRRQFRVVKGENHLNGEEALAFARERYHVKGGDNGRGKNQMRVITAIIQKATSGTTIISNYSEILASLDGVFRTSVPMEDISALVKMQLDDMATWNVKSFAVTGNGDSEKTYSSPGHKSYVMRPHKYMVEHASMLANKVINGEILTAEDVKAPKK